jgi:autoinducer binding domain-containing protein
MLEHLRPGRVSLQPYHFVPEFLSALVSAVGNGRGLLPYVESITKNLGFDSFIYGATATPKPDSEGKSYVYTTLPKEWVASYDQLAYIESDPRLLLT